MIEWLPYLGRVTTASIAEVCFAAYWVTALFRQGYDSIKGLSSARLKLSDCLI